MQQAFVFMRRIYLSFCSVTTCSIRECNRRATKNFAIEQILIVISHAVEMTVLH